MEQIRLDLIPGKNPPVCHASQYDVGRTIRLNLVEGGSEYSIPSGTTAEIHIRKPDNNIISAAVTATQGNKYIDIVTAEQWTACAGTNLCEIVLTNGGNVIGTINFILEVEMDPIDGGSASESVIYNIQALVDTAVALHTFLIHITETTITESAADILDAINSNKILQVIYKPDANNLTTHILPLTLDSGARPDGIRALAFAGFWGSKLYAADIVLDSIHSTVASLSMTNGKDLDETGDFPIHIHNSTITETAGEVLDAMADGLKPYVIWTNNSQSNYTFTYVLAAVWNPDATTETLIFGCPITGAVRTIHVYINPTTRTYSSSISVVDYNIPQINDSSTSSSAVWSAQKINSELADKAEIDDTAVSSSTAWSSEQIVSLLPTESASGAVASFETPFTLPLVSHNVTIEPVQAGTGDPSPSNPRAISGWSAINVTRAGKNLFDPNTEFSTVYVYGVAKNVLPSATCTLSFSDNDTTQDISGVYFGFVSSNYTDDAPTVYRWGIQNGAVVGDVTNLYLSENMTALFYYPNNPATLEKVLNRFNVQIELGTTATTYEPYAGQTYTRTFLDSNDDPVTVYGGSENLKTGEGGANGFIDLGDPSLTWQQSATATEGKYRFSTPLTGAAITPTVSTISDVTCEIAPAGSPVSTYSNVNGVAISNTSSTLIIYIEEYSGYTAADFKTAVTGHKLVYPLATPQTFHTDPLNLDTIEGVNNIWADTGDTAVEYKQDIQTYIDNRLSSGTRSSSLAKAPVETEETKQEEQEGDESLTR